MSAADDDDAELRKLLQTARDGDELALACLLAPHWCSVKLFCGLMLGDAEAADRAITDTLSTARSEVEAVDSVASVRMWIHQIAARACVRGDEP
jgi:DNA-directed RNA polymerase specialized sigma24 family protein